MDTRGQDQQIIAEFKRRRKRQLVAVVPVVAAMIPVVMLDGAGPEGLFGIPAMVLGPVCVGVVLAALVFSLVNWRCPACRAYLGKAFSPRFCQKCGAQLQE